MIPDGWRPFVEQHTAYGAYAVRRASLALNEAAFAAVSIRDTDWAPRCPWLSVGGSQAPGAAGARDRAILKAVAIRLVTGTGLTYRDFGAGAGYGTGIDANSRTVLVLYPAWAEVFRWEWRTTGAVTVDVETYFDVPIVGL